MMGDLFHHVESESSPCLEGPSDSEQKLLEDTAEAMGASGTPRPGSSLALPALRRALALHNITLNGGSAGHLITYSRILATKERGACWGFFPSPEMSFSWNFGPSVGSRFLKMACICRTLFINGRGEDEKRLVLYKLRSLQDGSNPVREASMFEPEVLDELKVVVAFADHLDANRSVVEEGLFGCSTNEAKRRRIASAYLAAVIYALKRSFDCGKTAKELREAGEGVRVMLKERARAAAKKRERARLSQTLTEVRLLLRCSGCGAAHDCGTDYERMPVPSSLSVPPGQPLVKVAKVQLCVGCSGLPAQPPTPPLRTIETAEVGVRVLMACGGCGTRHDRGTHFRRVPHRLQGKVRASLELVCRKCISCSKEGLEETDENSSCSPLIVENEDSGRIKEAEGFRLFLLTSNHSKAAREVLRGAGVTDVVLAAQRWEMCDLCNHSEELKWTCGLVPDPTGALTSTWVSLGGDLALVEAAGDCDHCAARGVWDDDRARREKEKLRRSLVSGPATNREAKFVFQVDKSTSTDDGLELFSSPFSSEESMMTAISYNSNEEG